MTIRRFAPPDAPSAFEKWRTCDAAAALASYMHMPSWLIEASTTDRFQAGDRIEDLAEDYGVPPEAVQNAIRCELRAA